MSETLLRDPARSASPRARTFWTVRALLGWLAAGLVAAAALAGAGLPTAGTVAIAVAIAVVAGAHLIVMPRWRYRVHRWEITDTAVHTRAGWFTQEHRLAPIARVQTVDTERGPLEQLFSLTNVTVTTASAKGPITIHALDPDVAADVVAHLAARAQVDGGDGT